VTKEHSYIVLSTIIMIGIVVLGVFISWEVAAVILSGIVIIVLWLLNPMSVLLAILLIRSSMDSFDVLLFGKLNLASILGIFIIAFSIDLILRKTISIAKFTIIPFEVFLAISIISSIFSGYLTSSLADWLRYLSLYLIYLIAYNFVIKDKDYTHKLLEFMMYSAIIPICMGFVQFFTRTGNISDGLNRVYGTFVHPNPFAFYLLIIVAVCYMVFITSGKTKKIIAAGIAVSSIILILFTYTRSAWIALFIILIIIFRQIKSKYKYLFLCLLAGVFIIYQSDYIIGFFTARFNNISSSKMEENSLATRLYIWSHMFKVSFNHPLLGTGLSTFELYSEKALGFSAMAHNDYLRILFETGIIGLLSYLYLLYKVIIVSFKKTKRLKSPINTTIMWLFILFAAMSFGDNIIDMLSSQLYLWVLVAIAHGNADEAIGGSGKLKDFPSIIPEREES